MACKLSLPDPTCTTRTCPPIQESKVIAFSGLVSDLILNGDVLSFKLGVVPITVVKVKEKPEWLKDGARIKVDTEKGEIELLENTP